MCLRAIFRVLFFLFALLQTQHCFSQKFIEPGKLKRFSITVNHEEYTIKTQMLSQVKDIKADNESSYIWYTNQKIVETKGGFSGKLIDGSYTVYYLNDQLKERGTVKFGLKKGEWKYWYPDGRLKEIIHWKNGQKSGSYVLYNDNGDLMASGHFKKDKLHGRFYTYAPNRKIADRKKYRRGNEVLPKAKKQKVKKVKTEAKKELKEKAEETKKEDGK